MGNDFLLSFLIDGKRNKLDVDAGRAAVDRLRNTPLGEWPEEFLESECGDVPKNPDDAESLKQQFVELLTADLEMVDEEVSGAMRHDLWAGRFENKFFMMTEAYRSLNRLAVAGIGRAMGGER